VKEPTRGGLPANTEGMADVVSSRLRRQRTEVIFISPRVSRASRRARRGAARGLREDAADLLVIAAVVRITFKAAQSPRRSRRCTGRRGDARNPGHVRIPDSPTSVSLEQTAPAFSQAREPLQPTEITPRSRTVYVEEGLSSPGISIASLQCRDVGQVGCRPRARKGTGRQRNWRTYGRRNHNMPCQQRRQDEGSERRLTGHTPPPLTRFFTPSVASHAMKFNDRVTPG
jgi:hypothetical protein